VKSGEVDTVATDTALEQVTEDRIITKAAQNLAGLSRILIGFVFLWAFLDKAFGLGYTTKSEAAWQFGAGDGSPTYGFLNFGTNPEGPFASTFQNLASEDPNNWVNWAFMLALLGAGVLLCLGLATRIAAIGSSILLFLMYLAEAPWQKFTVDGVEQSSNNPLIDDHIIYAVVLLFLMVAYGGRYLGFGRWWERTVPNWLQ
jgi:thiosulfate dehydrogenase [quinone] large subunit